MLAHDILRGMAELLHSRTDRTERDNGQPSLASDPMTQDANGNRGLSRGRKHRALDLILLLVALSGGLLALQNGRQLRQLRAEYERLSNDHGRPTDLGCIQGSRAGVGNWRTTAFCVACLFRLS